MSLFNEYELKKCVDLYKGDRYDIKFNCRDLFVVMSFAQFTDRAGLRDIKTTLNLCGDLYRSGIMVMPRSTLAEANEKKDWRIYQDFAIDCVNHFFPLLYSLIRLSISSSVHSFPLLADAFCSSCNASWALADLFSLPLLVIVTGNRNPFSRTTARAKMLMAELTLTPICLQMASN